MLRVVLLIGLAACWRGSPPEPAPRPAPVAQIAPDETADQPVICDRFDAHNPTCKDACPRDAPPDWPYCRDQTLVLLGRGFACTSGSPWSCSPAPPKPPCPPNTQCQPIHARVISIRVVGSEIEIIVAAGTNLGVTTSWKARLVDINKTAIAGGTVAILTVNAQTTTGRITATMGQLRSTPYVLLEP